MATSQAVPNENRLTAAAGVFAFLTCLFSSPAYLALVLLICRFVTGFRGFSEWAYLIAGIFALLAEPVALVIALLATILPIGKRGKIMVWEIAGGGVVAWIIAISMNPSRFS